MDTCIITRVQLDTRIKYACPIGRVYLDTRPKLTRVIIHVSIWTQVFHTRVQFDTCIKYTCPFWTAIQLDTCFQRHVSNWTRVYSNGYCRHASKCLYFCSDSCLSERFQLQSRRRLGKSFWTRFWVYVAYK
jgi:hypothetical protein